VSLIGGDTNEFFSIYDLPATLRTLNVDMGKGNDSMMVGFSDDYAPDYNTPFSDSIKAAVNVIGGDGANSIYIDDRYGSGQPTYTLTNNRLSSSGGGSVGFGFDVQSLTLDGKTNGPAIYNVVGSSSATAVVLNAGNGNDGFNVTESTGSVTMRGNAGNDYFYTSDNGVLRVLSMATQIDGGADFDYAEFNDMNNPSILTSRTLSDTSAISCTSAPLQPACH
jgi:hypothetical protein